MSFGLRDIRTAVDALVTKPSDTLWKYTDHTRAKHDLLVGYLHAWFPIIASQSKAINVIDGFAGPGRYQDGEPGSPLLMIDAFVEHKNASPAMKAADVYYDFVEDRNDRVEFLRDQLSRLILPPNVHIGVHEGSFDEVMGAILDGIPATAGLAPTFAFIDPFGYTGHGIQLSSRILQFKKCEVLIYVPWPHIARFIHETSIEPALDNLFGDTSWRAARDEKGKSAERILNDLFLERVRKAAGFALPFEIDAAAGRGWAGYTLYFGTHSVRGLEKMKQAMWRVDPAAGSGFAYSTNPDQLIMFERAPDLARLEAALKTRFGTGPFTIEMAERFTTVDTPFAAEIHLKSRTLAVAERAGRLAAETPGKPSRRVGQYTPGTILRFTPT
jgi:three-Cys-motif partner protein